MNKDADKLLFEVERQQEPVMLQLAVVDGVEPELEPGVWRTWSRYQRGYAIARTLHIGQSVYALYWHNTGYWGFVNYKVHYIQLCDECTIDNMAHHREYIAVSNKFGKERKVHLDELGYSVLTTIQHAQRAAAIKNAEDHDKVLLGVLYTRLSNY